MRKKERWGTISSPHPCTSLWGSEGEKDSPPPLSAQARKGRGEFSSFLPPLMDAQACIRRGGENFLLPLSQVHARVQRSEEKKRRNKRHKRRRRKEGRRRKGRRGSPLPPYTHMCMGRGADGEAEMCASPCFRSSLRRNFPSRRDRRRRRNHEGEIVSKEWKI